MKFKKNKWQLNILGYSCCRYCKHRLYFKDLIPIFSFLILRGKCRYCHKPIPINTFFIELGSAIIFVLCYLNFGLNFSFLFSVLIWSLLLVIFFYDLKQMLIPDPLVLGLLFMFLAKFFFNLKPYFYPHLDFISALSGSLIVFVLFFILFFASKGKWIGFGDVKLGGVLGLFLGLKLSLIFIWLSFIIGGILALFLLVFKIRKKSDLVPFAPFLIISYFILFFFPQVRAFFEFFLW